MQIEHFTSFAGEDVFGDWLDGLNDAQAAARVAIRIDRMKNGNFGDTKHLVAGVYELRIDFGPGYRVYYARVDSICVLLLCGGDKRKQSADIKRAIGYWKEYQSRRMNL